MSTEAYPSFHDDLTEAPPVRLKDVSAESESSIGAPAIGQTIEITDSGMTPEQVVARYFPYEPEAQKRAIIFTAQSLERRLESQESVDDSQSRVMSLLLKSSNFLKTDGDEPSDVERVVTHTLGQYLEKYRSRISVCVSKVWNHKMSLSWEDLVCEGQMGLIQALERFNLESQDEFMSYAHHRITGAIVDEVRENGFIIRRPRSAMKLAKISSEEIEKLDEEEIAVLKQRLQRLAQTQPTSIDEALNDGSGRLVGDLIADESVPAEFDAIFEKVSRDEEKAFAQWLLEDLDYRDLQVVRMRYGFHPYEQEYTFLEIGQQMAITESRVSQLWRAIEAKFNKKIELSMSTGQEDEII